MADSDHSQLPRWQLLAGELVSSLSDLAKEAPELKLYFETHAELMCKHLPIKAISYQLIQGSSLSRIHQSGFETIDADLKPEQLQAFDRAVRQVAEKGAPIFLPPHTEPAEVLRVLNGGDVPAPHRLPLFNLTSDFHAFLPIPFNGRVIGVFHACLGSIEKEQLGFASDVLSRACAVMELYFKARQVEDVTAELGRLHAYGEFLERLTGDFDLKSVAKALLAYAQLASKAERVSLLIAKDYREKLIQLDKDSLCFEYQYFLGEGVQCPEVSSAEAAALASLAPYFLDKAAESFRADRAEGAQAVDVTPTLPNPVSPALLPAPAGKRQSIRLHWIKRNAGQESEDPCVQDYLMQAPMNWVTYLPLVDKQQRIMALILFEGKEASDKSAEALLKMQGLVYAGGHALATALFWNNRRTLRWAKKWILWKDGTLDTPRKRKWAYVGGVFGLLLLAMLYPKELNIKAAAQVRPKEVVQISAQTPGRILSVDVEEGDWVQRNQLLMTLDTRELEFQRRRLESDFLQALAEADLSQGAGDEVSMQAALFKADRAEAQIKALDYQIAHGRISAPFEGLVLGPKNLKQRLGHVAKMGEPLIELAMPSDWEVKIQLYEQDLVYLEELLNKRGYVDASLKLTADPDEVYPLLLTSQSELSHGLEAKQEDYYFLAVLPLDTTPEKAALLKAGFSGRVSFRGGRWPLAYVLFRDLVRYLRVRFF